MFQWWPHSIFAFVVLALPLHVHASLSISEVFFDAPGTDENKEWIEVYNAGTSAVDISKWRFRENGTNHKLSFVEGTAIGAQSYAVIADDPTLFRTLYPEFRGVLIDSAFSLKNSSETLELLDETLNQVSTATYDSSVGAAGDGNSLNVVNGSWRVAEPSPGGPVTDRVLKAEPKKAVTKKTPEPSNLSVADVVVTNDAIDESGGDGDVLAASYRADEALPPNVNEGSGIMPWIALVVAISAAGIATIFMKKRNSSGYRIIDDES